MIFTGDDHCAGVWSQYTEYIQLGYNHLEKEQVNTYTTTDHTQNQH